ncbi:MAG: MotA/TolQ/ExbB proton channel family protein [Planctomycetota bacterium]
MIARTPVSLLAQSSDDPPLTAWSLFLQSLDVFTVVLVAGSIAAAALFYRCVADVRRTRMLPPEDLGRLDALTATRPLSEIAAYVRGRDAFPAIVLRVMLESAYTSASAREAAQTAADAECARWLRRIEPLSTIGNLAPLVGLAGTVWGMILAFTTIGVEGGTAGPAELSLGISKALFHTLLGLCLAVPTLLAYGWLRGRTDRLCDEALAISATYVERVAARLDMPPADDDAPEQPAVAEPGAAEPDDEPRAGDG